MKRTLFRWSGAGWLLVLLAVTFMIPSCSSSGHYSTTMDEEEYRTMINDYESDVRELRITDENLGGQLSKKEMSELFSRCNPDTRAVHFTFGIDSDKGITTLMFRFRSVADDGTFTDYFLRNGGSDDAYCPAVCDITDAPSVSMSISATEFERLKNNFEDAYPGHTLGGCFDYEMLKEFLDEVPSDKINIGFRFITDRETGNRSVVLAGAVDETGQNWYLRNGGSYASYCPINCE